MPSCTTCGHESDAEFNFCPSCGAKSSGSGSEGLVGQVLNGKYKVVRPIGQGAMGVVYEGEHVALQKRVALKVLHPDLEVTDDSLRRFQQEGIAAGRFTHPGAIQIFDFDREGDRTLYLAMEYLDGEDLKSYLKRRGRLAPVEAVSIARQVLSVLAEAHSLGIVHRDLKPDNVMVLKHSGEGEQIKVLDFGLSKLVDVPLGTSMQTQVGRILGTPLYMAPEQVAGEEVDHRADLYAMGLILYELLSGLTPFPDQSTTEILFSRATREAPSITDSFPDLGIPGRLDAVLQKALQRKREDRYQSAKEMLSALEAIAVPDAAGDASVRTLAAARSGVRSGARTTPNLESSDAADARAVPSGGARRLMLGLVAAVSVIGALLWAMFVYGGSDVGDARGAGGKDQGAGSASLAAGGAASGRLRASDASGWTPDEQAYIDRLDVARRTFSAGDRDAALVHTNDAIAIGVEDPEGLLLRARIQLDQGKLEAARADVNRARGLARNDAEVETLAGWIHLEDGRDADAGAAFKTAAEAALATGIESYAPALAGQAAVALATGNPSAARSSITEALAADDQLAVAHRLAGEIALAEGDAGLAQESLFRARSLDPQDWRTYLNLGISYDAQGDLLKAENQLVEARVRNVNALPVRQRLAAIYVERERWPEARDELRDALDRFPGDGRLSVLRAILLESEGNVDAAIGALEQGLDAGVEDGRAHALLGILLHARGELIEARDHYESARSLDDELALPWLNLGLLELAAGEWEQAVSLFEGALERDRNLAMAHFALGVAQRDYAGNRGAALSSFQSYRSSGGRDPRVDEWIDALGG